MKNAALRPPRALDRLHPPASKLADRLASPHTSNELEHLSDMAEALAKALESQLQAAELHNILAARALRLKVRSAAYAVSLPPKTQQQQH